MAKTVMKTRIIKIGNSQGVRLPKLLLAHIGFGKEVELEVQEDQIVIRSARRSRHGWDAQFREMAERGDDQLLDSEAGDLTTWDADEWVW